MLMNREQSVLLIVDVQARLAPFIHEGEQVAAHCAWLAQVAERVRVPVVVTEHFPEKIGGTLESVRTVTQSAQYVGKQCFSAGLGLLFGGCLGVVHRIDDGHTGLLYARSVEARAWCDGRVAEQLLGHAGRCGRRAGLYGGGRVGGRLGSCLFGGVQIVVIALVGLTLATSLLLLLL